MLRILEKNSSPTGWMGIDCANIPDREEVGGDWA